MTRAAAKLLLPIAIAAAAGCRAAPAGSPMLAGLEEVASPAAAGSMAPNLFAAPDGRVYLNWLEPAGGLGHALRFSEWNGTGWSAAGTIREADDFWINWADFPSLIALPDGRLAAHWLQRSGPGTYDYDVHITVSVDGGESWSASVVPHRDGTLSEHGFVSLFPWSDSSLAAVWLDGRHYTHAIEAGEEPEMSLHKTLIRPDGGLGEEVLLDERVCDCCQTSAVVTAEGPVVFYRDRSDGEVRDISVTRLTGGRWTQPRPVHEDGWVIPACPVNGPFAAADGRRVAVAWFTAAHDAPRVLVAFSDDAGATFGSPVRVDDGQPSGRVAVALLEDGDAMVTWLEQVRGGAEVRARRVSVEGRTGPSETVATSSAARASGFPRMVRSGDQLIFAWTDPDGASRVRVARAPVRAPR